MGVTENECVTEIEAKLSSAISVTGRERESLVSVSGIWVRKIPIDAFDRLSVSVNSVNDV